MIPGCWERPSSVARRPFPSRRVGLQARWLLLGRQVRRQAGCLGRGRAASSALCLSARHLVFSDDVLALSLSVLSACSIRVGRKGLLGLPSPAVKGTMSSCRSSGTGDQEGHPCSPDSLVSRWSCGDLESGSKESRTHVHAWRGCLCCLPSVRWAYTAYASPH